MTTLEVTFYLESWVVYAQEHAGCDAVLLTKVPPKHIAQAHKKRGRRWSNLGQSFTIYIYIMKYKYASNDLNPSKNHSANKI